MVKHTQKILRQFADKLFECVWPFCELALKGLISLWVQNIFHAFHSISLSILKHHCQCDASDWLCLRFYFFRSSSRRNSYFWRALTFSNSWELVLLMKRSSLFTCNYHSFTDHKMTIITTKRVELPSESITVNLLDETLHPH